MMVQYWFNPKFFDSCVDKSQIVAGLSPPVPVLLMVFPQRSMLQTTSDASSYVPAVWYVFHLYIWIVKNWFVKRCIVMYFKYNLKYILCHAYVMVMSWCHDYVPIWDGYHAYPLVNVTVCELENHYVSNG